MENMPKGNQYEYGQLQKRGHDFFFYYGQEQDKHENHVHHVLNLLARSNWEPCLYYEELEDKELLPTWIMRRLEE